MLCAIISFIRVIQMITYNTPFEDKTCLSHLQYNYVWTYENYFWGTKEWGRINSLPTECHLLITFANSLDPDQAWQNVRPDLDPNCLTHWWHSWKNFLKKLILKNRQTTKNLNNEPACNELTIINVSLVFEPLKFYCNHMITNGP